MPISRDELLIELYRTLSETEGASAPRAEELHRFASRHPGLNRLVNDILGSPSVSTAMEQHPRFFPLWQLEIIQAGQSSGQLAQSFRKLAEILEERRMFFIHLMKSLALPIAAVHLMPLLACGVYYYNESLNGYYHCYLRFLSAFYVPTALLIGGWYFWLKNSPRRRTLPIVKSLAKAEFSFYFASMIKGNVPFDRALNAAVLESGFRARDEMTMLRAAARTFSAAEKVEQAITTISQLGVLSEQDMSRLQNAGLSGQIDEGIRILARQAELRWQAFVKLAASIVPTAVYLVTMLVILIQFLAFLYQQYATTHSIL